MNLLSRLFSGSRVATAVVLPVLLAAVPTSHASQILLNAGFESGAFAPWATTGGTITNTEAHTGTYSFAAFSSDSVTQTFAPVATSSISEVSFWAKRDGGVFDAIFFYYSDASNEFLTVNTLGGSSDWTFFNVTADLDAGKSLVGFLVYGTSPGPAYLDDFTIDANVVDEPLALALFGAGLAGLGWSRRRPR